MTLDEARDAFEAEPNPTTGAAYIETAEAYHEDGMISDETLADIKAKAAKYPQINQYIVIGGHSWAKDRNAATAFNLWVERERPRGTNYEIAVFRCDEKAYVDEMGTLYGAKGTKKLVTIQVPARWLDRWYDLDAQVEEFFSIPVSDAEDKEEDSLS